MPVIDECAREINFKIVYYGPALAGKATCLRHVFVKTRGHNAAKWPLPTGAAGEPAIDLLPVTLPLVAGLRSRWHFHTVPGSLVADPAGRSILAGVDGVVFVADSQRERSGANFDALADLAAMLDSFDRPLVELPMVMQYNKRDVATALPVAELDASMGAVNVARFESVATTGVGVYDAIRAVAKLVLARFHEPPSRHGGPYRRGA